MIVELVWFKLTVAGIDRNIEEAIQAVHIQDGTALCIIGLLPWNTQSGKEIYVGEFAQIIQLYDQLESEV